MEAREPVKDAHYDQRESKAVQEGLKCIRPSENFKKYMFPLGVEQRVDGCQDYKKREREPQRFQSLGSFQEKVKDQGTDERAESKDRVHEKHSHNDGTHEKNEVRYWIICRKNISLH